MKILRSLAIALIVLGSVVVASFNLLLAWVTKLFNLKPWELEILKLKKPLRQVAKKEELEAFFLQCENFKNKHITDLTQTIGEYDDYYDAEHGRIFYMWNRAGLRVLVSTQSNHVYCVQFLASDGRGTFFGTVIQTVWDRDATQPEVT